ncbi:serine hydrolase [Granulicatella sp. UMB5615A]|uniref:serine hydrolase n=1 Tax=Granulicatella sp. UMB5615A TaxID=3050606 RepID=UPI002554A579|nr:serine hydrolase [Granulicatella sp. UMB5615A]MDK8522552.1 serine hydrolase [Granulicatella sp. UMB5615A]
MKKLFKIAMSCVVLTGILAPITTVLAQESSITITKNEGNSVSEADTPKGDIVVNLSNGEILFQENPDNVVDPASLSKLMTIFMVYDAIKSGKIKLEDKVVATKNDQAISNLTNLSNSPIVEGVEYPVSELIKMALLPSSNAAVLMLANLINPNADDYVDLINQKAQELGMTHTKFVGASGAVTKDFEGLYTVQRYPSNETNQSTARDLAKMVVAMVKAHPEITEITKNKELTVMSGTPYAKTITNTNHSVEGDVLAYPGIVGLKTGTSERDGFNYIGIYKQDGVELVEVILGVGQFADHHGEYNRHKIGNALLQYVFKNFEHKTLFNPGTQTIDGQKVTLEHAVDVFVEKGKEPAVTVEGNTLKVQTNYGTLYGEEYTVKVEQAASDAQESTYIETTQNEEKLPKRIIEGLLRFLLKVPFLVWLAVLGFLFVLVMILNMKKKFKRRKTRINRRGR